MVITNSPLIIKLSAVWSFPVIVIGGQERSNKYIKRLTQKVEHALPVIEVAHAGHRRKRKFINLEINTGNEIAVKKIKLEALFKTATATTVPGVCLFFIFLRQERSNHNI
jgi:hypothetical protein